MRRHEMSAGGGDRGVWREGIHCPLCGLPIDESTPMPDTCLRCYLMRAPDLAQFATRVRIVKYLFDRLKGTEND